MYDELVKWLRETSIDFGELDDVSVMLLEAADAIEELMRRCEQFQYMPPPAWIPVTERLPEHECGESTSVLAVDLYGVMRVTYFDGGNWCWPSGEALTTTRVAPITHWMPLPEPPKEIEEENT